MDTVLFIIFAVAAIVCAFNLVFQKHPISSALSLIGVMASLAVLYLLLGADLSAILFTLGVAGFVYRKSIITVFMSIELMLNAVNLSFVTFSYQLRRIDGHIYSFFVMVVAAAEAAVGLAIILTIFKNRGTLQIDEVDSMKL